MGYAVPIPNIQCYNYDTTTLIVSSDTETSTASGTYVLAKEFTLRVPIFEYSIFYLSFEMKTSIPASEVEVQLKINDVEITSFTDDIGGYQSKTYKIEDVSYYKDQTKVQLYLRENAGGATQCFIRNVRIYGLTSPFQITQEVV